jgi:hypothetical protein
MKKGSSNGAFASFRFETLIGENLDDVLKTESAPRGICKCQFVECSRH